MAEAILLVDDDPQLMHVLATFFDLEGYHVLQAEDGQAAMDMLKEYQPDLVMLDLVMPGANGVEICQQIRANHKLKDIPVVVFTAADTREEELLAAGANRFIAKPYSLDGLRSTVRELMGAAR